MIKNFCKHQGFIFCVSWVLSMAAAAYVVPQLYWDQTFSHFSRHDPESPFMRVFILINQWANGGWALFDRFDHFHFAYDHLALGIYTVSNVLTAGLFYILSPFLSSPAQQYSPIFIFVFQGINALIRTAGGYLILRRMGIHPLIIVPALVLLNTLLSLTLHLGLLCNNLYSYLPLLMYLFWAFCEDKNFKLLAWFAVVLTIAVANSPLMGLGYFYMVLHFFIVSNVLYQLIVEKGKGWKTAAVSMLDQCRRQRGKCLMAVAVCILIIAPNAWMFKLMGTDTFIPDSGLHGTQGRFQNALQPLKYFDNPHKKDVAFISKFLFESVDYVEGLWEGHWPLIGAGILMLSLIGLVMSRVRAKWIFAITIVLVILCNTPVTKHLPLGLAHWINALTNPFSFLLRTFHMPTLLLPMVFMPLAALGLQALFDIARRNDRLTRLNRQGWMTAMLLGLMVAAAFYFYYFLKLYVLAVCVALVGFLYGMFKISSAAVKVTLFAGLMFFLVAVELSAARVFVKTYLVPDYLLQPRLRPGLDDQRPILIEQQNPLHLPFREFLRSVPLPTEPLIHSNQSPFGIYYKYPAFERYFEKPSLYNPLPTIYKNVYNDRLPNGANAVQQYLNVDDKIMFLADAALCGDSPQIKGIVQAGLQRRIVAVEGSCQGQPRVIGNLNQVPPQAPMPPRQVKVWSLDLAKAKKFLREGYDEYRLALPDDFPEHMASALFARDKDLLMVIVDGGRLNQAQGSILGPYYFDVNNIAQGYAVVTLPQGMGVSQIQLAAALSPEIVDVKVNTHDRWQWTYRAWGDGWLVMHWPYDSKWVLKMDGQPVPVFRANQYFIATPIAAGDHVLELSYWPGSLLRILIPLSVLLSFGGLIGAVYFSFKRKFLEQKQDGV